MERNQAVSHKKDYNLLTRKLLEEGYTAENHPDYVKVCTSAWGKELWQNLAGGFEYTPDRLRKMTFRTGCGLLVNGGRFLTGSMSYKGKDWIPENDNPVICCPYRRKECGLRDPVLDGCCGTPCECHETEEPYAYEQSIEKIRDEEEREKREKYEAFAKRVKGHVCQWHMRYDYSAGEWIQKYDPMVCAQWCQKVGGICSLTKKPVSKKRGNVFYDVRTSHVRRDGTLFDGEKIVQIEKGIRLFQTAKSMTICERAEKMCREEIIRKVENRYYNETQLLGWKVEVLNIRAEQRESRDLMQDLQDIKAGIQIYHASDKKEQEKEQKRERRKQAQEKRVKKIEKKILEIGFGNMEFVDQARAYKLLGQDRIDELEVMREKRIEEDKEKPTQMSIFEFLKD